MARNIEIKAKISDLNTVLETAQLLVGSEPELIEQKDVFFHSDNGRFKLRFLSETHGELIFYQRSNISGPKTSTYRISETNQPNELRTVLAAANGEKITVRKVRHLFHIGRTRIHVDVVADLGEFLELEVVLDDTEGPAEGEREALELMAKLGIKSQDLVEGAYADMLAEQSY